MKTKSYRDLVVYDKAYRLAMKVYRVSKFYPREELYGIVSQMRRCAVSIPSNIAEGYRRGRNEYLQFLKIAHGSCAELETQLMLSHDLGYIKNEIFEEIYDLQTEVSKILMSMIKKMERQK
jgi:four helix bundle protein